MIRLIYHSGKCDTNFLQQSILTSTAFNGNKAFSSRECLKCHNKYQKDISKMKVIIWNPIEQKENKN